LSETGAEYCLIVFFVIVISEEAVSDVW